MAKEYYEAGKTPWVTVERCGGNLLVKNWADSRIAVEGNHEAEESEGMLTIRSGESLTVWFPAGTSLTVGVVEGDLVAKGIDGELQVESVNGDFALKAAGAGASIGVVHGDLAVRSVEGPLKLGTIHGDVACRNVGALQIEAVHGDFAGRYVEGDAALAEVMGDIALDTVNGDVAIGYARRDANLSNLGGLVDVKQSDGDIRLRGSLIAGKHHLTADGDIVVRWPAAAPLSVHARANSFANRLALEELEEQMDKESGKKTLTGRIGDGEPVLVLEAGGRVVLKETGEAGSWEHEFVNGVTGWTNSAVGAAIDLSGVAEQISTEIGAKMAEFGARMEERFGGEYAQRMAEKAARKAEHAVARAAKRMEQEQRRGYGFPPPPPPASPPKPARKQPSADEQVKILSMLEKGIISVEEAETLLRALEE
jgi:hypothetical protein